MRRIAVINQKGGVGKTTTTANLGAALMRAGRRVLLVDLDPQGHLSLHYGTELADDQLSVYDVLTGPAPLRDAAVPLRDGSSLIPADIDLAGVETELVSVMGREVILREAIEPLLDQYDVLLVDCPPSLGVLTINALVAAHEVLIPLQAQFFALQGLGKLLNTVTLVKRRINPSLNVTGIVLCVHDPATRLAAEVVADLTSFLEQARGTDAAWADARLFETYIRRNIKLAEASSFGQTIFDYAPRSNGAVDYARLAAEVFAEMGIASPARTARPADPGEDEEPTPQAASDGSPALGAVDDGAAGETEAGAAEASEADRAGATVPAPPVSQSAPASQERPELDRTDPPRPLDAESETQSDIDVPGLPQHEGGRERTSDEQPAPAAAPAEPAEAAWEGPTQAPHISGGVRVNV